jgi:flagellar basal body-associated protein FliL
VNQTQTQHFIPSNTQIQKPNIYPLEPFFIPILSKNKETGKFLHVTAHLVLSNRRLHKDIDKVRPLIRQSVYNVISRRKSKDFEKEGVKMEEKIKREILTSSNSFLLSGTGTITNIIFTEFIVSPS